MIDINDMRNIKEKFARDHREKTIFTSVCFTSRYKDDIIERTDYDFFLNAE